MEGYISPSTDLTLTLNYDYGGYTQSIEKTIEGSNEDILEEFVSGVSLGQASLGQEPIGGSSSVPSDSRKFDATVELAREDFKRLQPVFSSNDVDFFWSVLSFGGNVVLSKRRKITNKI